MENEQDPRLGVVLCCPPLIACNSRGAEAGGGESGSYRRDVTLDLRLCSPQGDGALRLAMVDLRNKLETSLAAVREALRRKLDNQVAVTWFINGDSWETPLAGSGASLSCAIRVVSGQPVVDLTSEQEAGLLANVNTAARIAEDSAELTVRQYAGALRVRPGMKRPEGRHNIEYVDTGRPAQEGVQELEEPAPIPFTAMLTVEDLLRIVREFRGGPDVNTEGKNG